LILPMKKVCLFVRDKYQQDALLKLRSVGVVHIKKNNAASEQLSKVLERKAMAENAVGLIQSYKTPSNPYAAHTAEPNLVELMVGLGKERKALEDRQIMLAKERGRIAAWGNFNPASVKEMASLGQPVYLYELSHEAFAALGPEIRYIKLSEDKNGLRLLVLDNEIPATTPFQLPEKSLAAIDAELGDIQRKLKELEARIVSYAVQRPALLKELKVIQTDIEFETARAELEKVEGVPEAFGFSCLTGFVPTEDLGKLKAASAENGWALVASDPGPDDNVPTKLRNNPLASLINPLTGFLEVTPGYNEVDISGWFLLFFTIYFGMIFGDAAYGAIVLIAAIIGIFKTAKKGVPAVLKLVFLLGLSNFVWGVLTCTWGGMEAEKLPLALQNISVPLISNATAAQSDYLSGIVQQNLMILCFSLALLQLSIGHLIAITKRRSLKILADLGSIAMLVGMYGVILILIASNKSRNLGDYIPMMPCAYILGAGFVFNFVFASYEGSIGKSVLESCKNIISMVLGIANVFSDIMSYIRLWAVGLAGAAIASTVNAMAGPMLGHLILFVFGVVLIVFGHGLNLVLNALSVLVHGVRLNTLEFSGHVGLTWAGFPYKPFSEKKDK